MNSPGEEELDDAEENKKYTDHDPAHEFASSTRYFVNAIETQSEANTSAAQPAGARKAAVKNAAPARTPWPVVCAVMREIADETMPVAVATAPATLVYRDFEDYPSATGESNATSAPMARPTPTHQAVSRVSSSSTRSRAFSTEDYEGDPCGEKHGCANQLEPRTNCRKSASPSKQRRQQLVVRPPTPRLPTWPSQDVERMQDEGRTQQDKHQSQHRP